MRLADRPLDLQVLDEALARPGNVRDGQSRAWIVQLLEALRAHRTVLRSFGKTATVVLEQVTHLQNARDVRAAAKEFAADVDDRARRVLASVVETPPVWVGDRETP